MLNQRYYSPTRLYLAIAEGFTANLPLLTTPRLPDEFYMPLSCEKAIDFFLF